MFFTSWVFCRHLSGRQKNEHFSLFRGRFGAGRFIQPAATVFGQFRLRVCFKNNLNCKFPPSLYLLPVSLWLLLLPWCFIYFIFFDFYMRRMKRGDACAAIAVNWYGITYMDMCVPSVCVCAKCVSVCVCNLICVATIKCNLRLAGHLEVWVGERRAASFESCLRCWWRSSEFSKLWKEKREKFPRPICIEF